MFETVEEVDEETATKEKNIQLTREPTASLLSGSFEYSYEINNALMIEGDVTKNKKPIGKFRDGYVFLLNDVESTLHDQLIENIRRNRNMNKQSVNIRNSSV